MLHAKDLKKLSVKINICRAFVVYPKSMATYENLGLGTMLKQ